MQTTIRFPKTLPGLAVSAFFLALLLPATLSAQQAPGVGPIPHEPRSSTR